MSLLLLAALLPSCQPVMFPYQEEDMEGSCDGDTTKCLVSGAVSWLEEINKRQMSLGSGIYLAPEPGLAVSPEGDHRETKTLLETLTRTLSSRRLLWQMDWLYPGLRMVVNPDSNLFFSLDRRLSDQNSLGTGRLAKVRRAVLPMLLGTQLKTATLVPLLVAVLLFLAQKAILVGKLSLLLSALGTLQREPQSRPVYQYQSDWPAQERDANHSLWN